MTRELHIENGNLVATVDVTVRIPLKMIPVFRKDNAEASLSARERQIFALMISGKANKEIGAALNISVHTVKFHVASVLRKFGVAGRRELILMGMSKWEVREREER